MVPQKLFDYLSAKKKAGYPDAMMKEQFLKQGWSLEVLNEAYAKLNTTSNSSNNMQALDSAALSNISSFTYQPNYAELSSIQELPKTETEIPKKWVTSLTILFIFLSGSYQSLAAKVLTILIIFQKTLNSAGSSQSIMSMYPTLYIAVILLLSVSIFIFYLAFKARNFSEKSWKLGLSSIIIFPIVLYPLINLLCLPLFKQVSVIGETRIQFIFPGMDMLYILAILIILWFTKKLHTQEDASVSTKVKFWVIFVAALGIISMIVAGYILTNIQTPKDMGYENVVSQTAHKVYRIETVPENLDYATAYTIETDDKGESLVKVAFDTPFTKLNGNNSLVTIITQQKSPQNYDAKADFTRNEAPIQSVAMPIALNQIGYLARDGFINKLEFVTNDGVLVKIMSPNATDQLLMSLAQQLK